MVQSVGRMGLDDRTALDSRTGAGLIPAGRVEVLGRMAGRRRVWTLEQKLAILAEADQCDNVMALARRYDIRTSLIYTWRRELRYARQAAHREVLAPSTAAQLGLVPVVADAGAAASCGALAMEVEVAGTVTRIFAGADAALVASVLRCLSGER